MSLGPLSSGDSHYMPARLRHLFEATKLDIRIHLNGHKKTYTTGDTIEGTVAITPPTDTPFDDLDIEFVGTSRTYVERLTTAAAVSGRQDAFKQLLRLSQPNVREHLPEDRILRADQTYTLPFLFVIPQQLVMRTCSHKFENPAVHDAHSLLPPSLGPLGEKDEAAALDDMAPAMASIRYGIFIKLSKDRLHEDKMYKVPLGTKARRVNVLPATEELPPLDVSGAESNYTMRKEKTLRKGMIKGKLGTLVIEAAQPASLRMRSHFEPDSRTTTMASIMLRFDPAEENSPPPRLGSLASKLRVNTFFANTLRRDFPSKQGAIFDPSQGLITEQLNLTSRCVANVEWTTHSSKSTDDRRDSASSLMMGTIPEPSKGYKGKTFYTARILSPIELPTNKAFVPTFHSCLCSRTYALKLELGLQNMAGMAPTMDLKVPIQVSADARSGGQFSPRTEMEDMDLDDDVEQLFEEGGRRHRLGSVPLSGDAPPGYSAVPHRRHMSVPVY